jgi:hypothetical protein
MRFLLDGQNDAPYFLGRVAVTDELAHVAAIVFVLTLNVIQQGGALGAEFLLEVLAHVIAEEEQRPAPGTSAGILSASDDEVRAEHAH